jgi:hypothetical protein
MCVLKNAYFAWWCVSKATLCELWRYCYNSQGANFGASHYVSCCNAQSKSHSDPRDICTLSLFYQLPNCNLFAQHVIFILWRDTTSEHVDPGLISFILLSLVYFTRTVYFTRILLLLSTRYVHTFVYSKPVRLTTSS